MGGGTSFTVRRFGSCGTVLESLQAMRLLMAKPVELLRVEAGQISEWILGWELSARWRFHRAIERPYVQNLVKCSLLLTVNLSKCWGPLVW